MNDPRLQRTDLGVRWLRLVVNVIVCVVILAAAVAVIYWINQTEPVAQKAKTTRKSTAIVETITVNRGTWSPGLVVLGTVRPAQQITLRSRVDGQVLEVSPAFVPGGKISAGDMLLRIDPSDLENALSIRQSELAQTKASMEIEEARQRLAEKELKLLEGSIDDTNRGLVLREPQVASIKAEVSAADAAVERVKLDLQRTTIYAPFDAQVMRQSVNVGSQVSPGNDLGQLVGMGEYWVMAAIPLGDLRWVEFPSDERGDASGSKVTFRSSDAWGPGATREGRVSRLIGSLDEQTRLAQVVVSVPDPLGRGSGEPPLILDSLLETEIEGKPIDNVVRLRREYVRDEDTAWVMKNGKLEIRDLEIKFRDGQFAYISKGLEDGEEVVISTLATPARGIGLKKKEAKKPE